LAAGTPITMIEPILFRRQDTLSPEQALYWKDLLYRTLKIGTEIEFALPKGARKQDVLPPLDAALQPTKNLTSMGKYGVLDIVSEHCGLEIQVLGRQPYYPALYKQYRDIFNLLPAGIRARPTCGLHYHILPIGLSESVPEIILANIWNLVRRYAPALKYLTSGGDQMSALCRRRNHNSHLEMVRLSPGSLTMQQIYQQLHDSKVVPEHQNFLNLEHVRFDSQGAVSDFHLEFRFCDADLSPISITAKTFLFLAMILKAVEMSQYGVIHVGRIREWRRKEELLNMLSNNDGPLATSDTSQVTPDVLEELRAGCRELLALLKPILTRFEHNPSFAGLSLLAETPISLLRIAGHDWPAIEALLSTCAEALPVELDQTDRRLMQCIELAELTGYPTATDWQQAAARELFLPPQELAQCLQKLNGLRGMTWDPALGTMLFNR